MNESTKDTLLPCPFCGGEPEIIEIGEEYPEAGATVISCKSCGASSKPIYVEKTSEHEVIDKLGWNQREAAKGFICSYCMELDNGPRPTPEGPIALPVSVKRDETREWKYGIFDVQNLAVCRCILKKEANQIASALNSGVGITTKDWTETDERGNEVSCMSINAGQPPVDTNSEAVQAVIFAAGCISHWHDAANGGMVVSAEKVRNLWKALATLEKP